MSAPVLIGCSHGTNDPAGRLVIGGLLDDVRAARPELDVREAFVDVQEPAVADVVAGAGSAVVVPLLLSAGYHVGVDIGDAVAGPDAAPGPAVAAAPLGPDPRLVEILLDRLQAVGTAPEDTVVLAAAGSSHPGAAGDVERVAEALRRHHPGHVTVGYGSIASPSVADAVAAARDYRDRRDGDGLKVVVAAYLLAPGFFHDRLLESGADAVTGPLGPDPRLAAIVLDRYDAALARLPQTSR